MQRTQEEIAKAILAIHMVMDCLDDGYHNTEIGQLVTISNGLMERLTPTNQKKMQEHYKKKQMED